MRYTLPCSIASKTLPFVMTCSLLLFVSSAWAEVSLPTVLSDHMVLQRDEPVAVWGKAEPGETVTVSIEGQTATTTADESGHWRVDLSAMPAGGPFTMTVAGANTLTLEDVYVGEVWLCSGQSNMWWPVGFSVNAEAETADADWPMIRMYTAQRAVSAEPQDEVVGSWQVCLPQTVGDFSAVGYYFGRELHRELDVPIGLVHSSWSGSRAEPWTPRQALMSHPDYAPAVELIDKELAAYLADKDRLDAQYDEAVTLYQAEVAAWNDLAIHGGRGVEEGWASQKTKKTGWREIQVPGAWEAAGLDDLASFDGVVWLRREISITSTNALAGRDLILNLGPIDDVDSVYINGEVVGSTGFDAPYFWAANRRYTIPGRLVNEGVLEVVVRVCDIGGGGGFMGTAQQMTLVPADDEQTPPIMLAGAWQYRIDFPLSDLPQKPVSPGNPSMIGAGYGSPAAMYNGMLHPLVPYGLRGAIWYQGESNAGQAQAYRELLPLMIRGWRDAWSMPDMPFGIVQLANFTKPVAEPRDSRWARLRDAQLHTFKIVPNTGLAVIIDIGEADDIHPKNKQDVGGRLALWALSQVYGQDILWSGPIYQSMRIEDGKAALTFDHVEGLQVRGGGSLQGFSIAGEDQLFVWAEAEIVGDEVVVWSDQVPAPVAVRYGWANNPDTANLVNQADLPASPFRTDLWMEREAGE